MGGSEVVWITPFYRALGNRGTRACMRDGSPFQSLGSIRSGELSSSLGCGRNETFMEGAVVGTLG